MLNNLDSKECSEYFFSKIQENSHYIFKKTEPVLVREVDENFENVCSFEGFAESVRKKISGEILCKNPKGQQETWFTDKEKLYIKTDLKERIELDGELWDVRVPNSHRLNFIGGFQYNGELGDVVTFFKPLYGTEMSIKKGGWLVFNLDNNQDIWCIEENAMNELYSCIKKENNKSKPKI